ncbi:MAG: flagellar FliJ family protein [Chloroflexi bacterium]|nr:flagellar FliJ family protein [Chloroflexota bacterium]
MKPFRFTLQALLTLRQREEQVAIEDYARALQARQQALAQLDAAEHELSLAWHEWHTALAEGCVAAQAAQRKEFCESVAERRNQRAAALAGANRAYNQALQKMLSTRRQRRAVETYFVHQRQRYDRELLREEQKTLDDLVKRGPTPALAWTMNPDTVWN